MLRADALRETGLRHGAGADYRTASWGHLVPITAP